MQVEPSFLALGPLGLSRTTLCSGRQHSAWSARCVTYSSSGHLVTSDTAPCTCTVIQQHHHVKHCAHRVSLTQHRTQQALHVDVNPLDPMLALLKQPRPPSGAAQPECQVTWSSRSPSDHSRLLRRRLRARGPAQEDAELLQTALAHLGAVAVQTPALLPQLMGPKVMALLEAQREVHPAVRKALAQALQAGLCAACAAPGRESGPGQGMQVRVPCVGYAVNCSVVGCSHRHEHHAMPPRAGSTHEGWRQSSHAMLSAD